MLSTVEKAAELSASDSTLKRAILIDDDAKDFLDNQETKKVVDAASKLMNQKIDILGMDACLMSMAEVVYQMKDGVLYTVGSQETEPVDGWPYDTILTALIQKPDMSPDALCKLVVQNYVASYRGSDESVTQSACDLKASVKFAEAFKTFASAMKTGLTDKAVKTTIEDVRNRVQDYQVADNVDLVDLCQLLKDSSVPQSIKSACDEVIASVQGNSGLVIESGNLGTSMEHSNGLAIYFPTRLVSPLYAGLDFTNKTGWGDFLEEYIEMTRSR